MEMVTVDNAIKKGRWLLLGTPIFIALGTMGLFACVFLYLIAGDIIWVNVICSLLILFLPAILSVLYYFYMLPRWRIWAFSNVRNVHELKQRAILGQIYPKDDSFLWRFEIKNEEQKQQIEELDKKFALPDVFVEDYNMPFETSYSYSKIENAFYLLCTIGAAFGGITIVLHREYFVSILLLMGSGMFGFMAYKRMSAGGPVLTISNDGITTKEDGFHAWCDIKNEQIFFVSAGRASYFGLSFEVNGESVKMKLSQLTGLSSYKIDHVLRTYRGRYEASKPGRTYN